MARNKSDDPMRQPVAGWLFVTASGHANLPVGGHVLPC